MRRASVIRASVLVIALSASLSAQLSLQTTLAGGNGQSGNMFDITNISGSAITITGFDQNFFAAATCPVFEIYTVTAGGSYAPVATTASAWTLQGSTTNVVHPGPGTAVPIPIPLAVVINPGQTLGFYVTCNTADTVAYTNGTVAGNLFASDSNIQFFEGIGVPYPFLTGFTPRVWNGIIRYSLGSSVSPLYETNGPTSSLDFNGVQGGAFLRARTSVCVGGLLNVNAGGTAGQFWEAAFSFAPLVDSTTLGSFVTGNGQVINIDGTQPFYFLNGGAGPALIPFAPFSTAVGAGSVPGTVSFQLVVTDPTHPDGAALSQGCEVVINGFNLGATPIAGPIGDDSEVLVPVGCINVFGRSFTQLAIESNGRVMYGSGNTSYSPTVAQFLLDSPSFGIWTDFNPSAGGTITLNSPAPGILDVAYAGVVYWGTTTPNTFNLTIDTVTGIHSISGLAGIAAGANTGLMGISGGNAVTATDPGAAVFSPGGAPSNGSSSNATNALYMLGTLPLTTGITRIDFLPNGLNNFDWVSS